jgi:hypothetical protein
MPQGIVAGFQQPIHFRKPGQVLINAVTVQVGPGTNLSGLPTNQELVAVATKHQSLICTQDRFGPRGFFASINVEIVARDDLSLVTLADFLQDLILTSCLTALVC